MPATHRHEVDSGNLETRNREYNSWPPLFANMILADEINRCPPKTQAAMLESMQERQISRAERSTSCPPRLRVARKPAWNRKATYPRPSAARPLPALHQGRYRAGGGMGDREPRHDWTDGEISPVLTGDDIIHIQKLVTKFRSAIKLRYAVARPRVGPGQSKPPDFINRWRIGAPARAACHARHGGESPRDPYGRYHADRRDVQAVASGPAHRNRRQLRCQAAM